MADIITSEFDPAFSQAPDWRTVTPTSTEPVVGVVQDVSAPLAPQFQPTSAADLDQPLPNNTQVVNGFDAGPDVYSNQTLEIREPGDPPAPAPAVSTPTVASVPFSRKRAMKTSLLITILVLVASGLAAALFFRQEVLRRVTVATGPTQSIGLSGGEATDLLPELSSDKDALLINGDIITKGQLKLAGDNNQFITIKVLQGATLQQGVTISLPAQTGTVCLDVNNCGFATQAQLGQVVIPPATLVNGIVGNLTFQGTLNQISLTTQNGVITLTTPQDLAQLSSPTFSSLLLNNNLTVNGSLSLNLNCTSFTNGGNLTTDTNGQVICTNDDGGAASTITGVGTIGRLPVFDSTTNLTTSWLLQNTATSTLELDTGRNFAVNGSTLFVDATTGRVGIGTTTPVEELEISSTVPKIVLRDTDSLINTNGHNQALQFADGNGALTGKVGFGTTSQVFYIQNGNSAGRLYFSANATGGAAADIDLAIIDNGNVGIGTTAPNSFKLEVAGNVGPEADNTRDLGSVVRRWANIYGTNVIASNLSGAITPTGFTQGSVAFAGLGGTLTQNNANFFWDDTNTRLHIGARGSTLGTRALDVYQGGIFIRDEIGATTSGITAETYGLAPTFRSRRASGTLASPTAVATGQSIAQFLGGGYGATGFLNDKAQLIFSAAETWTDSAAGTNIGLWTTPMGSITPAERLRIDSTGNVGIGTATPDYPLQVNGSIGATGIALDTSDFDFFRGEGYAQPGATMLRIRRSSNQATLSVANRSSAANPAISVKDVVFATDVITLHSDGNAYFAGNVGIGTTTPAYKLDVSNGTGIVGQFSGRVIGGQAVNSNEFTTKSQLDAVTGGTAGAFLQGGNSFGAAAVLGTNDANDLIFRTNGTTRLTIDATTGNTTLSGNLAVDGGNITSTGALTVAPAAGNNFNVNLSGAGNFAVNTNQLYVQTSTERVGIGTITPGAKLEIVNNTSGATSSLLFTGVSTDPTSGGINTILIQAITSLTANNNFSTRGLNVRPELQTNGFNATNGTALIGVSSSPRFTSSGTATGVLGSFTRIENNGTGTIDRATGARIDSPLVSGGGSVTNAIGLAIQNNTTGTNNTNLILGDVNPSAGNYSLYSASNYNSYFAGNVGIGTATPGNLLSVGALTTASPNTRVAVSTGADTNKGLIIQANSATQSADLLQTQDSTGAVLASIDNVGNLTVKNATINGTLTVNGHIKTGNTSGSTTITAGAAACTTPTVSVSGNDTAGTITITTGTGCVATGVLGTVTFANAYGVTPRITLTPGNANAAGLQYYRGTGTTTFTLQTNTTPTDTTTYIYDYQILE